MQLSRTAAHTAAAAAAPSRQRQHSVQQRPGCRTTELSCSSSTSAGSAATAEPPSLPQQQPQQQQQLRPPPRIVLSPLGCSVQRGQLAGSAASSVPIDAWDTGGMVDSSSSNAAQSTAPRRPRRDTWHRQQQHEEPEEPEQQQQQHDHQPLRRDTWHRQPPQQQQHEEAEPEQQQHQPRRRDTWHREPPQQQEQHQQYAGAPMTPERRHAIQMARLTRAIGSSSSIAELVGIFQTRPQPGSYNLIHTSSGYRVLTTLITQRRRQQQHGAEGDAEAVAQLLALLEQRTIAKLAGAVAATAQRVGSSASSTDAGAAAMRAAAHEVPGWDARAISTIIHSCAHLGHRPEVQYLELLLEAYLLLHEGDAAGAASQGMSSAQPDAAAAAPGHSGKPTTAQERCHALSLLCWALARLGFSCTACYLPSTPAPAAAQQQQQQPLDHSQQQQQLAQQQEYWARLAAVAMASVPGVASARDVSMLAYGLAAAGCEDVVLWSRLGAHATAVLDTCTAHDLAQLLWAFATARVPYQPLLQGACKVAVLLLPYAAPQGLANMLWAVASLQGRVPEELLAAATKEALARDLASFGPVNLNMLVWACSRNRCMAPELAVAVNRAVLAALPAFSTHNLARMLGSLAVLQCLQPTLLAAAAPRLLAALEGGRVHVQVATQAVWAFASVDAAAALRLLPHVLALVTQHPQQLARSSDSTSKFFTTLQALRYRADACVDVLAACLQGGGSSGASTPMDQWHQQLSVRHIVLVALALARLGYSQHAPLLQLLMDQYLQRMPASLAAATSKQRRSIVDSSMDMPSSAEAVPGSSYIDQVYLQHALLLLWCAAVLDMRQPAALLQRLVRLLPLLQEAEMTTSFLAQAAQVDMWLQTLPPATARRLGGGMPAGLAAQARQVWRQQVVPAVTHSELHAAVLTQLRAMRLAPVLEGVTQDGMFSVDIMLSYKGVDVALEVMGPEHYSVNPVAAAPGAGAAAKGEATAAVEAAAAADDAATAGDEAQQQQQQQQQQQHQQYALSGPDLLRLRLLAARGYALVTVSSYELGALLNRRPLAVRQLLRGKLDEAVAQHAATASSSNGAGRPRSRLSSSNGSSSRGQTAGDPQQPSSLEARFALQSDMRPAQERRWHSQRQRTRGQASNLQQEAFQAVLSALRPDDSSSSPDSSRAWSEGGQLPPSSPPMMLDSGEFELSLDMDELLGAGQQQAPAAELLGDAVAGSGSVAGGGGEEGVA